MIKGAWVPTEVGMKRIIKGKTYNTATATEIFHTEHPASGAWFGLYQTRHGAFFKVKVDHGGENILEFDPVGDEEAQKILEQNGQGALIEKYFGPMPEGGAAERRFTMRIPENLAQRVESAAKVKGQSFNNYAMRALERAVRDDGLYPAVI